MIDLASEIADALDGFTDDVAKALERTKETLAKEAAKEVKAKAPTREGKYKKSISLKRVGNTWVVYAKRYQLTHLLEKGHAKKGGGRTRAYPHWRPAEELIVRQATQAFKRELK